MLPLLSGPCSALLPACLLTLCPAMPLCHCCEQTLARLRNAVLALASTSRRIGVVRAGGFVPTIDLPLLQAVPLTLHMFCYNAAFLWPPAIRRLRSPLGLNMNRLQGSLEVK